MTCLETYATLRIFSSTISPDQIGKRLGVTATELKPRDRDSRYRPRRETNYWGWSTKDQFNSRDNLSHIAAITNVLKGKESELEALRSEGCQIDICNFWVSNGQGGPELDLATIKSLDRLRLEIWWDIWFGKDEEYPQNSSSD